MVLCRCEFYYSIAGAVSTETILCSSNTKTHHQGHTSFLYVLPGTDSAGEETGHEYETRDTGSYQGQVPAPREQHKHTNKADISSGQVNALQALPGLEREHFHC